MFFFSAKYFILYNCTNKVETRKKEYFPIFASIYSVALAITSWVDRALLPFYKSQFCIYVFVSLLFSLSAQLWSAFIFSPSACLLNPYRIEEGSELMLEYVYMTLGRNIPSFSIFTRVQCALSLDDVWLAFGIKDRIHTQCTSRL